MNKKKRTIILQRLLDNNTHPATELNFSSPFELLLAVLLSAQAKDVTVNKVTTSLYLIANTPKAIIKLGIEKLKSYIRPIGLFNNKAKNIIRICYILLEKYNGKVPEDRTALESLPGVGRKTANILLNTAFGWPTIAVDTHVFRVCNRTNFASGKSTIQVEEKLLQLVPTYFKTRCHDLLVSHGRYICVNSKPRCRSCIIKDLCEFKEKNNF